MQTKTRTINEAIEITLGEERELLNAGAYELIKGTEEIKPIFYYNRMISKLFPDSDFAIELSGDYSRNDRKVNSLKNKLIDESLKNNIPLDTVKNDFYPLVDFEKVADNSPVWKSVRNMLTRTNESGIVVTGLNRKKIFLCTFAFNLDFEALMNLMSRCLGECTLNYKNPYEVILAYCTIEHGKVFSRYVELKERYENLLITNKIDKYDLSTNEIEEEFIKVENDEELLSFILKLPNCDRNSAKNILNDVYVDVKTIFQTEYDIYRKTYNTVDEYRYITNALYGDELVKKTGDITFIKSLLFSDEQLKEMLEGQRSVTKSALMILLFYRYVCFDEEDPNGENSAWNECLKWCDEKNIENRIAYLFGDFKSIANSYLIDAGFSELYLPNVLERLLTYCLISEDPIETFQVAFSSENLIDVFGGKE